MTRLDKLRDALDVLNYQLPSTNLNVDLIACQGDSEADLDRKVREAEDRIGGAWLRFLRATATCVLLVLAGCTPEPIAPIAVPTGTGTEAIGKYEVHVVRLEGSAATDLQQGICGWMTAHPELKFVWSSGVSSRMYRTADVHETVIVGYAAAR